MVEYGVGAEPTHARKPWRGYRYAVVGIVAGLGTTLAPPQLAQAQARFVPGTATATSQAMQIAPRTGGLGATITVGTSIADYRGSLAQASSQTLDMGLIGTDLTIQCDSSPPLMRPDQLPQPLIAESDHGSSHATKNTVGGGRSGVVAAAGRETVTATKAPQSTASFDGDRVVIPGLVAVSGMHSHSHARLVSGKARIATATSQINTISLLGGKVKLAGLEWLAGQRSGAAHGSRARFRMSSARLAGHKLPVTASTVDSTFTRINKALKSTGLHVTPPKRSLSRGKLAVSALSIGIDDSKLGGKTLNPILETIQPVTNKLSELITGVDCKLGNFLTLADLALSAVDGTGGLDVNLGGATAATDSTSYGNPFGGQLGGHHLGAPAPRGHVTPGSGRTTTTTTTAGTSGGGSPGTASRQGTDVATTARTTATSSSCATISPAGWPSCSRGHGLQVGLGALGLLVAFAGTDFFVLRRRRRLAADE
jgi:hypothetical protein